MIEYVIKNLKGDIMKTNKALKSLIVSAMLTAISFVFVYFVPTIDLGVWSFTLGSHVPTFIACFISPYVAVFTYLGTLLAFMIKVGNPIVWLRAGSHLGFVVLALLIFRKVESPSQGISVYKHNYFEPGTNAGVYVKIVLIALLLAVVHAALEVLAVLVGLSIGISVANSSAEYILITVGVGTMIHSLLDFFIAYLVFVPLRKAVKL